VKAHHLVATTLISLLAAACASTSHPSAPVGENVATHVEADDEGEIVGTPLPGGGFAKLTIGMDMQRTQEIMGRTPDRFHTYESGKRWIPFYFGTDARRLQAYYKEEGCLTFTNGNAWGGGGGELILIENDTSGACYQP
jgi:hypothetical protein